MAKLTGKGYRGQRKAFSNAQNGGKVQSELNASNRDGQDSTDRVGQNQDATGTPSGVSGAGRRIIVNGQVFTDMKLAMIFASNL